jgi:four helix bundle protein
MNEAKRGSATALFTGEAAETQVWLEYSVKCRYMSREDGARLHKKYDEIIGKLINMGNHPQQWCLS